MSKEKQVKFRVGDRVKVVYRGHSCDGLVGVINQMMPIDKAAFVDLPNGENRGFYWNRLVHEEPRAPEWI